MNRDRKNDIEVLLLESDPRWSQPAAYQADAPVVRRVRDEIPFSAEIA